VADKTLLDTDIFSELMRGKNDVVRTRAQAYVREHGRLSISAVTVLEIVKGFQKAGMQDALERFVKSLGSVEVITLGPEAAILSGRIYGDLERLRQTIGRADPMIAGVAILHGLVLAAGNQVHYARIQAAGYNLVLDNWRSEAPV
jgi:tRNA(fMet)-specific endonuclease VapC